VLLYLNDFLSGRQARIKVNDLIGEWMSSDSGTSAGTILGAILFIAYVHDAPKEIFPKFADDFAGIAIAEDIAEIEVKLQELVNELLRWSEEWDLKLNLEKTKVMAFSNKQTGSMSICADGHQIEKVEEFKYLGVMLDSRLRFDAHAEYAATKARKAFSKINRLINKRQGLSVQCGLELYKTLVRPHMEYSLPAWATMPESSIKLLEKVQAQCLRVIMGTSAHPSTEALEVIGNVMPVRVRIEELCIREYMRIKQMGECS